MKSTLLLVFGLLSLQIVGQTPCENGFAGDYPCNNVELMAVLTPADLLAEEEGGILLNDIWGWTDPTTKKEYVLVGMANGTSFVDISDPIHPIMLGILPEHHAAQSGGFDGSTSKVFHDEGKSIWRDIKVYNDHAYIVSEDANHGVQIFDLTQLRNVTNAPQEFKETAHYDGLGNAHNIVINEQTGYAYAVGVKAGFNCRAGGLHIINIQNPTNPIYEACFDDDGYTHDAQCVIYNGPDTDYQGKEICFNSNEDTITIVNVDNKSDMSIISRVGYDGVSYAHQGWLTEDHKYFLSNDELDEYYNGTLTTTFIWDVQDLDNPIQIGTYTHTTTSIDHNLYIVGDRTYESNYTSGLRILDISDIANANLVEIGFFDTYPDNDDPEFHGTWSNYPFFESGIIAVSDITNGLFLLQPHVDVAVISQPENIYACVGEHFNMGIEVFGSGLSYKWQIDIGNGFEDITDFNAYNNTNSDTLHIHEVVFEQNKHAFRCKITDSNNEIYYSNSASLLITDNPVADFEFIIEDTTVEFINDSYAFESYTWDFGDNSELSTELNPIHNYTFETINYNVLLTTTNECAEDTMEQDINIIVT